MLDAQRQAGGGAGEKHFSGSGADGDDGGDGGSGGVNDDDGTGGGGLTGAVDGAVLIERGGLAVAVPAGGEESRGGGLDEYGFDVRGATVAVYLEVSGSASGERDADSKLVGSGPQGVGGGSVDANGSIGEVETEEGDGGTGGYGAGALTGGVDDADVGDTGSLAREVGFEGIVGGPAGDGEERFRERQL